MKHFILAGLMALTSAPAFAQAQVQKLASDPHITKMLVGAQVGDLLRKSCPKARARMFVVLSEMLALQTYAKNLGSDDAQINAFLDDQTQKRRIRALADDYLAQAGAKAGDEDSYCSVARAEVAAGTVAGKLIRVTN